MKELNITRIGTLLVAFVVIGTAHFTFTISKSRLISQIEKTYKDNFGSAKNIYDPILKQSKTTVKFASPQWATVTKEVENFVKAAKNEALHKMLYKAVGADADIINSIKVTFINAQGARESFIKTNKLPADFVQNERNFVKNWTATEKTLADLSNDLDKLKIKKGVIFSSSEEEAKEVLSSFIYHLRELVTKVRQDYPITTRLYQPQEKPAPVIKGQQPKPLPPTKKV